MDSRQISILEAVVDEYIKTGNAVSSKKLSEGNVFGVSSATIRSELARLEAEGYLVHPHTSSGRVPTDKGFRFYVDRFIRAHLLPRHEREKLIRSFKTVSGDIEGILHTTSCLLAELTSCFCVITAPELFRNVIKMIRLVLVNVQQVLVVLLTSSGISKDFILNLDERVDPADLDKITNVLNSFFSGMSLSDIEKMEIEQIMKELPYYKGMLTKFVELLKGTSMLMNSNPTLFRAGTAQLMRYSDFDSISELRGIIEVLEQERRLFDIRLEELLNNDDVTFVIGSENPDERLKSCTVAQVTYAVDENVGALAVVGPRRIRYMDVSNLLKTVSFTLQQVLKEENPLNQG